MNRLTSPMFVLAVLLVGCSSPSPAPDAAAAPSAPTTSEAAPQTAPATAKVTLVEDASLVCMVNNQFMGKPQIPVVVEGITYYGCCEMCKSKLADDPTSRAAIDPISGASVDKARAVLGKTESGAIHYFESAENLAKFAQG
jgi:YHS domain-containing protein